MADNVEHGPSSEHEINPKVASDIHYWAEHFKVSGEALHEAIRVHGTSVEKVKAALAAGHVDAQHQKQGR
ncbi:DUF3606 domain-containing protein [Acidipila sp. EB88]|uniref:DUF3606 domain-containing protein n=1 Tax=Acidipila sp. EB88 TaxID=2305226 RepID=UPI000F60302F|nr:DUF3606 domain-containing protein [Acidipila sp. EB88]RRA50120.1 DUF3606 domain-containing protein [Acidipila sp. EB88]